MVVSRLRRVEERRLKKRVVLAILGSLAILTFLTIFGLKILVGFSLFIDKLRGATPAAKSGQTIILPPSLNPLPEATNSANLSVSGTGQPGLTLILYINEQETKKLTVPEDGNFTIADLGLHDGNNVLSAKLSDDHGNLSELSNIVSVLIKRTAPDLEVTAPTEGSTINGDKKSVAVVGKVTDGSPNVTVNGRFVVVSTDGSFRYEAPLSDGANTLVVVATDQAGNQTTIQRHVTYQR